MIAILCPSFAEAKDAFYMFLKAIQDVEPWRIQYIYDASYCVETDDDLRYIFTDYRLGALYSKILKADLIDQDEFFELEYGTTAKDLEAYV